jgi:hypothetical protein
MIKSIDYSKYPSNVTKENYEVIRELMTAVLTLDGYKTYGEGAHKALIDYIQSNYKEFTEYELKTIDELRILRNRIAYDGFFVSADFLERKKDSIDKIIFKLKKIINDKILATRN